MLYRLSGNIMKGCNTAEVYSSNFYLKPNKRMICIVVSSFPYYDFRAPHPDKSHYFIYPEAAMEIQFFYISSFVGIRYPFTHTVCFH